MTRPVRITFDKIFNIILILLLTCIIRWEYTYSFGDHPIHLTKWISVVNLYRLSPRLGPKVLTTNILILLKRLTRSVSKPFYRRNRNESSDCLTEFNEIVTNHRTRKLLILRHQISRIPISTLDQVLFMISTNYQNSIIWCFVVIIWKWVDEHHSEYPNRVRRKHHFQSLLKLVSFDIGAKSRQEGNFEGVHGVFFHNPFLEIFL